MKRTFQTPFIVTSLIVILVVALLGMMQPRQVGAAPFTAGNIVVYRVGNGSGALVNTGNPVFLDEYTPAGVLVQSIPMPTAAVGNNKPLVASGISGSEGGLNLSADGRFLVFAGYNATIPHATSLASSDPAVVNRVIGRVDAQGNVDTTTSLNNFAGYDNPREVASDNGARFWGVSGNGSVNDPLGLGGVFFATLGASSGTTIAAGPPTNVRSVNIFGGQLYASSQQGSGVGRGILTVGSGLPTTAGQSMTLLPGLGSNTTSPTTRDFVMLDLNSGVAGVDTIYSAHEWNGLRKYSLVGGTWVSNGVIHPRTATANDPAPGDRVYRRITAAVSGNTVSIFVTRYHVITTGQEGSPPEIVITDETNGELIRLIDTNGYNQPFSDTNPDDNVIIPASDPNTDTSAIRGVALAPVDPLAPTSTPTASNTPTNTATATTGPGTPTVTTEPTATTGPGTPTVTTEPTATTGPGTPTATVQPTATTSPGGAPSNGVWLPLLDR
jgi:hypothetical protein